MNHRPVTYKDCKYNTSKTTSFVGYCDLPKYTNETGKKLDCEYRYFGSIIVRI